MFQVTIYRRGRKKTYASTDWHDLRIAVAAVLKDRPEAKWGELRDDNTVFVKRYRKRLTNYPLQKPKA